MAKYRKKPIVVEAEQFLPDRYPWPEGVFRIGGDLPRDRGKDVWCRVKTREGELHVSSGDWIITGIQGERYPCKPDIFEASYEKAEVPVCDECGKPFDDGFATPGYDNVCDACIEWLTETENKP